MIFVMSMKHQQYCLAPYYPSLPNHESWSFITVDHGTVPIVLSLLQL